MYAQYQSYHQQTANSFSTSQQGNWTQKPANTITTTSSIPPNPVAHYTKSYHGWESHRTECEQFLKSIPMNDIKAREEAKSRVDWATYYSNLASRAAHHFYQNPNAITAPFELPPDPPQSTTPVSRAPARHAIQQQQPQRGKDDTHTPGSLARFLTNCLRRCSTQEQKKLVQAEIEAKIAAAIQRGDLHNKNWDIEPLIPVPGAAVPQYTPQQTHYNATTSQNQRLAGFQIKAPIKQHKKHVNGYMDKLPQNNSYYGHASSSSPSASTSHYGSFSSSQTDNHYYGPSSHSNQASTDASPSSFPSQNKRKRGSSEDFIPFHSANSPTTKSKKMKQMKGFKASHKVLAKRANRFSGPGGINDATNTGATSVDGHEKYMGKRLIGGSSVELNEQDYEQMTVKGRCMTLEKEYLRLTAPPRADLVRPEPILKQHLNNLKEHYARPNRKEYLWFCSQLKAIRQDCTVQRLQNGFAVDAYETHAQIALKEGDLNEYNQCQTQLKELYEENRDCVQNQPEFIAYRLLYYVFLSCNEKYDGGSSDMLKIMTSLTNDQRSHPAIAHALKIREAIAFGDYLSFFRSHFSTPNLGHHLTSLIAPTMRIRGLRRMAKSYKPTLDIDVCIEQLGFGDSVAEGKDWLVRCGCVIDGPKIVMKDSVIHEPEEEKKNSLI